jgi:hypothetical protein
MLDVWPTLPLVIWYWETGNGHSLPRMEALDDADNIIYALGHRDRVSQIFLENLPLSVLDRLVPSMQESFPALTCLEIEPIDGEPPLVLQDSFLGGSTPCLRSLRSYSVRFPALQKLLLSASNLVNLELLTIPVSAYISPEAMSTLLPSFPRLEVFYLGFQHPAMYPRPAIQHPSPTRVLHSLTRLWFSGHNEYLDQLVARINAPLLNKFDMMFHNQGGLDVSQLPEFIDRVEKFKMLDRAEVFLCNSMVNLMLSSQKETSAVNCLILAVRSGYDPSELQFLHLAQVVSSFTTLLSSVERLDISENPHLPPILEDDMENLEWLQLLFPFPAVKDLYLSGVPGLNVARTLRGLDEEGVKVVLPALQRVFLEGPPPSEAMWEAIKPFMVTRQLSGYPVTIGRWEGMQAED